MTNKKGNFGSGKLLYSRISDQICDYIAENKIEKEEKLPSERELAGLLKVSRNSIREALRELENHGVVRVEAGRGSFVTGEVTDRSFIFKIKKHNFFELFEIKSVLEEHMIRELTPTISIETLNSLESVAMQMITLADNGIFPQELDDVFHRKLLESYRNKEMFDVVWNILGNFMEVNDLYFNRGLGIISENNRSIFNTVPWHLEIVKAMKSRSAKKAVEAYRQIVEIDIEIYSLVK